MSVRFLPPIQRLVRGNTSHIEVGQQADQGSVKWSVGEIRREGDEYLVWDTTNRLRWALPVHTVDTVVYGPPSPAR